VVITCVSLCICLALAAVVARLLIIKKRLDDALTPLRVRFSVIHNIEAETQRVQTELVAAQSALTEIKQQDAKERKAVQADFTRFKREDVEIRNKVSQSYKDALVIYDALKAEVASLEEHLEDISYGLYNPHFTFATSAEYKIALETLRNKQRECIRKDNAAHCPIQWQVGNSLVEGKQMVKQAKKVLLRAFNGECDAAIANVTWNNVTKMEERLRKSFTAINACGRVTQTSITDGYLQIKLDEVRLTHEYEEKRWTEKEEQRMAREAQREELKAVQEIEKAQEQAEEDVHTYEKLLAKARDEAAQATGVQLRELAEKVVSFEAKLDEARKKKEKAISRAQLTKSGFVYVISNIGAFGNDVYKIGMTRRMEPTERIAELSGAAVPFPFDLHAMMYSDNAPELETSLRKFLDERRVNLVNPRKEFYRNVQLLEIQEFVTKRGLSAQFTDIPEARQWRETLARRDEKIKIVPEPQGATFSEELFGVSA
jgi:Domain of unknown function (DUF4041)/Meiotically up-regulated gene 113